MPHFCIVVAGFYEDIAAELSRGAADYLAGKNISYDIVSVPGAFEIPAAVRLGIASGRYSGYVALGCVVRGDTSHYDYVCGESARGLNELAMKYMAPIGYGILTVENMEQAWVRAAVTQGNKGAQAADAALRILELKEQLGVNA
jgi:6,7-dimethyl-8-ribityllumazine synthase